MMPDRAALVVAPILVAVRHAARRWAEQLEGWGIPEAILRAAPEPPWAMPPGAFVAPDEPPDSPSRRFALGWLGEGGAVLDVGCGAGAASLALVPPATELTGVDQSPAMLARFAAEASRRGVEARTVEGGWPGVAASVPPHDVVVCHHVAYNVADLVAFVVALSGHARRGVVLELTGRHPLHHLAPLWRQFWDLERPAGPTAEDALAVLRECGLQPQVAQWERPRRRSLPPDEEVALVRRRLCLTADRDPEVAEALERLPAGDQEVWSFSWPGDG